MKKLMLQKKNIQIPKTNNEITWVDRFSRSTSVSSIDYKYKNLLGL